MKLQGSTPKVEEKTWISRGVNAKKWKVPGGGVKFKNIDILIRGDGSNFFLESPICIWQAFYGFENLIKLVKVFGTIPNPFVECKKENQLISRY